MFNFFNHTVSLPYCMYVCVTKNFIYSTPSTRRFYDDKTIFELFYKFFIEIIRTVALISKGLQSYIKLNQIKSS